MVTNEALVYVQFGCGLCAPRGWRNFDAGPSFWLQHRFPFLTSAVVKRGFPKYPRNIEFGNIVLGLPIGPESAHAVYCSHVLEHLTLEEFRCAIRNVHRYLRTGGHFRLVVPDLEYLAVRYVSSQSVDAASQFMRDACLGEESYQRGIPGLLRAVFGRTRHFWMWDYKGLARELEDAGFFGIRRAAFGDSDDPRFAEVEELVRWENCLGIECCKRS